MPRADAPGQAPELQQGLLATDAVEREARPKQYGLLSDAPLGRAPTWPPDGIVDTTNDSRPSERRDLEDGIVDTTIATLDAELQQEAGDGSGDGGQSTNWPASRKSGASVVMLLTVAGVVGMAILGTQHYSQSSPLSPVGDDRRCGEDDLAAAMDRATVACNHTPRAEDDGTSSYPADTECTASCNEGYRAGASAGMLIQATRTCINGEWSGPLPICAAEPCTSVDAPANAVEGLQCSGRTGDTCEFECKAHYQISGSSALVCGADKVFRGTGTCGPIDGWASADDIWNTIDSEDDPWLEHLSDGGDR